MTKLLFVHLARHQSLSLSLSVRLISELTRRRVTGCLVQQLAGVKCEVKLAVWPQQSLESLPQGSALPLKMEFLYESCGAHLQVLLSNAATCGYTSCNFFVYVEI